MKNSDMNVSFSNLGDDDYSPEQKDLKTLANLLEKFAPHDGIFNLPVTESIHIVKATKTNEIPTHAISKASMCVVASGAKRVVLGEHIYEYDQSRMVVYAAEVPVAANIIKASQGEPYLGLVIQIEPKKLMDLIFKVFPQGVPKIKASQAIYLGNSNPKVVTAAIRLMNLIIQQEDSDLLIPLIVEEILIRLLRSPAGVAIAQIGIADSNAQKVTKAISWVKNNFSQPIKVDELAKLSGMSPSSFHQYFKMITSMSPLQFQKVLRLQSARNLMLSKMLDVSSAAEQVGYTSVSQFSREYTRHFGNSPIKDIAQLKSSQT